MNDNQLWNIDMKLELQSKYQKSLKEIWNERGYRSFSTLFKCCNPSCSKWVSSMTVLYLDFKITKVLCYMHQSK